MGQRNERVWSGGGKNGRAYSGVPAQNLLGEMSYWDDVSPKRGKDELESLGARHGDSERECPPSSGWESHGEQENKIRLFFMGIRCGTTNTGKW